VCKLPTEYFWQLLLDRGYKVDVVDLFWFGNHLRRQVIDRVAMQSAAENRTPLCLSMFMEIASSLAGLLVSVCEGDFQSHKYGCRLVIADPNEFSTKVGPTKSSVLENCGSNRRE
jgi:hypothetical protein